MSDDTPPKRRPDSGSKPVLRSSTIKGQPTYRHYGKAPLKRRQGIPVIAREIPIKVLPREMIEPLTDPMVQFLVAFWKTKKRDTSIALIGYSQSGFNKWLKKQEFKDCLEMMEGIVKDHWEGEYERSWTDGYEEHKDIYDKVLDENGDWDGETLKRRRVETRTKRDTSVLREINRALQPEKYGQAGGPGGTTINIVIERPDARETIEAEEVQELAPVEIVEEEE